MNKEHQQSAIYLQAELRPLKGLINPQSHQLFCNPKLNIRSRHLGLIPKGHLRLEMLYAGICGTDIHVTTADPETGYILSSAPADIGGSGRIIGHEGVGRVLGMAADVMHIKKNQLVAFESITTCGYCEPCRSGKLNQCNHGKLLGMEIDGLFGDIVDIPANLAFDISAFQDSPGGIMTAACLEPTGVAYLACKNARIKPGERVAILGAGPIGLLTVMLCKLAFGVSEICLVEPLDFRRQFASQWADICLTPDEFLEDRREFEVIIDASGDLDLVALAINKMSAGGRIGLLARNGKSLNIDKVDIMITRNLSIFGSRGHLGGIYEQIARLYLNGLLPIHHIVTKLIYGLDELADYITHPEVIIQENCKVMCKLDAK